MVTLSYEVIPRLVTLFDHITPRAWDPLSQCAVTMLTAESQDFVKILHTKVVHDYPNLFPVSDITVGQILVVARNHMNSIDVSLSQLMNPATAMSYHFWTPSVVDVMIALGKTSPVDVILCWRPVLEERLAKMRDSNQGH